LSDRGTDKDEKATDKTEDAKTGNERFDISTYFLYKLSVVIISRFVPEL
jgi:hypothetical protein